MPLTIASVLGFIPTNIWRPLKKFITKDGIIVFDVPFKLSTKYTPALLLVMMCLSFANQFVRNVEIECTSSSGGGAAAGGRSGGGGYGSSSSGGAGIYQSQFNPPSQKKNTTLSFQNSNYYKQLEILNSYIIYVTVQVKRARVVSVLL